MSRFPHEAFSLIVYRHGQWLWQGDRPVVLATWQMLPFARMGQILTFADFQVRVIGSIPSREYWILARLDVLC